ncbi:hypothetical protein OSB04_011823 [Centaurea solstitialis]|uniref:Protein kinase domain-containing protein n=1 Tax=Centaurea solstitialis TaxID=347529 RepID=A0AA38WPH8_9ASTR|nr:hypothetical protein OSB04_011823 [Centaurea solstitialis]
MTRLARLTIRVRGLTGHIRVDTSHKRDGETPSTSFEEYLGHLRIPLQEIRSATNNFDSQCFVGYSGYGDVYKGRLLWYGNSIEIVANRVYHLKDGTSLGKDIISVLLLNKHENLASLVGFCDEEDEKIVVLSYDQVNGTLDKYLIAGPTQFTWFQRLRICVDVARALNYLHHDTRRGYSVMNNDIKSRQVLVYENWVAKVCDFGLSIKDLRGRNADPVLLQTRTLSHKYDVYSFGVLLFEVLYGKEANIINDDGRHHVLTSWFKKHYEDGSVDKIIDPDLRKQMDPQSFTIFSDTTYQCLDKQQQDMETIFKALEKALELQEKHENPDPSYAFSGRCSGSNGSSSEMTDLRAQMERMEARHQEGQKLHRREQEAIVAQLAQHVKATNTLYEWLRSQGFDPPPPPATD